MVLALAVGLGLISMHTGVHGSEHAHGSDRAGALVATETGDDATHAPLCDGCGSHSSAAMVCAVLLVAVARVAVRVVRRRLRFARLVHVAPMLAWCSLRASVSVLARPPNLHALQVMRC